MKNHERLEFIQMKNRILPLSSDSNCFVKYTHSKIRSLKFLKNLNLYLHNYNNKRLFISISGNGFTPDFKSDNMTNLYINNSLFLNTIMHSVKFNIVVDTFEDESAKKFRDSRFIYRSLTNLLILEKLKDNNIKINEKDLLRKSEKFDLLEINRLDITKYIARHNNTGKQEIEEFLNKKIYKKIDRVPLIKHTPLEDIIEMLLGEVITLVNPTHSNLNIIQKNRTPINRIMINEFMDISLINRIKTMGIETIYGNGCNLAVAA